MGTESTSRPKQGREWCRLDQVLDAILESKEEIRVAFAISGGGATGAYQAGVLKAYMAALSQRTPADRARLEPKIIVGTSAGALNAFTLLIDRLGLADPEIKGPSSEPYVTSLWRVIASRDRAARFVVGKRHFLIAIATRWVRSPHILRLAGIVAGAALLFVINPLLFAILARSHNLFWLDGLAEWVLENPVPATLASAVAAVALALFVSTAFRRAMFGNAALRATLANAVRGGAPGAGREARLLRRVTREEEEFVGQRVAEAWYAAPPGAAPDFIVSTTDLTAKRECLFTLASPKTYRQLAVERWQIAQIGRELAPDPKEYFAPYEMQWLCGATSESYLIRAIVASTSIPCVFPSQRIRIYRVEDGETLVKDFVDGGVLNNAPIHIAIDAGATHVLSIELNPLRGEGPLAPDETTKEPLLLGNLVRTFETLLDMATGEDIRRAANWNQRLEREKIPTSKRLVPIFRVAPTERKVDTIEFNGHYVSALSRPSPGLIDWLEQGYTDASAAPIFWDATFTAYPDAP